MTAKINSKNKIPTIILVGRSNVGKSTLFNFLAKMDRAIVSPEKGTTRDWQEVIIKIKDQSYRLIDTPGLTSDKDQLMQETQKRLLHVIKEADLIFWVVDGSFGQSSEDTTWHNFIRAQNKETWLIVNKCDNPTRTDSAKEYLSLGFKSNFFISALHRRQTVELVKEIVRWLRHYKTNFLTEDFEGGPKFKIVVTGRLNVGKSTIVNCLLDQERVVTANLAGTTRDSIETRLAEKRVFSEKFGLGQITIVDSAGIPRHSQIHSPVEKASVDQSKQQIKDSDLVLLVIDATIGITRQDLTIAGLADRYCKSLIIVANKWDLIAGSPKEKENIQDRFIQATIKRAKFLGFSPLIFTSGLTKQNIYQLRRLIGQVIANRFRQFSTAELENFLADPYYYILQKIKSINQIAANPPTFLINNRSPFHLNEIRQLKNAIREHFSLFATPIKIEFKLER